MIIILLTLCLFQTSFAFLNSPHFFETTINNKKSLNSKLNKNYKVPLQHICGPRGPHGPHGPVCGCNKFRPRQRSSLRKIHMTSPEEIIELAKTVKGSKNFDVWSYSEFLDNIKKIDSAAIIDNQHLILFSEKVKETNKLMPNKIPEQITNQITDKITESQLISTQEMITSQETNPEIISNHLHLLRYIPSTIDNIIQTITTKGINYQVFDIQIAEPIQIPIFVQLIAAYIILNTLYAMFLSSRGGGGGGAGMPFNPFNAGRKPLNLIENGEVATSFEDVAGLEEAKEELEEIVDYLKFPLKYTFAGAKIPKGVLLEGPPGTGKTLLARAVAGEADVSFISASGSEFIEMFVGVGAQRVRNLFEQALQNKPCVIFIDEIDAVGGRRGYGFNSGGNDEREQTLNQILTNMDGFDKSDGVIVLAATNRADTLDPALKRSGRFDRKITVNLPDFNGRKAIAKVHFKNKPNVSVDYNNLARLTSGFSGADLATLANEAALLGVRGNKTVIDDSLVFRAFEKITIGLPKKYDSRNIRSKRLVAIHEIGHTMMVQHFSKYFKLQSVTMNANTNGAGGYTLYTPNENYSEFPTRGYYLAQIIITLGGRAAEIVYYRTINQKKTLNKNQDKTQADDSLSIINEYSDIDVTAGASGDLNQANQLIKEYLFLFENYISDDEDISESTKSHIDYKIKSLIIDFTEKAIKIIENDIENFNLLSTKLLKENTIIY